MPARGQGVGDAYFKTSNTVNQKDLKQLFSIPVIVAALGYFVDIYDLLLFSIVRRPSLMAMGVAAEDLQTQGEFLIQSQMAGLLVGGIIWGIMGDKRGRLSVLFGSILLYSLANIANGFATTVPNFIRGTVIPLTLAFKYLRGQVGDIHGALIIGVTTIIIAFIALRAIDETFGRDMNFEEID